MFKRTDLARALAEKKISVSKEDPVELISFDAITLGFAGTPPADLLPLNELALKVSGSGTLLWRTDEVALKSDLVGRSKSDLPVILKNYPTISSASATLRPFWKSSFPEEGADITIKKLKTE